MIKRIWHGWTPHEHADAYQTLLDETIVPGIARRRIRGHRSTEIWRERPEPEAPPEVAFVTVMTFDDWDAVCDFAGGDGRHSVVPTAARELLSRYDATSTHFELVANHADTPPIDGANDPVATSPADA